MPQLLLVAEPDLGGVVDLGADVGLAVQVVLARNAEVGGVGAGAPAKVDAGLLRNKRAC